MKQAYQTATKIRDYHFYGETSFLKEAEIVWLRPHREYNDEVHFALFRYKNKTCLVINKTGSPRRDDWGRVIVNMVVLQAETYEEHMTLCNLASKLNSIDTSTLNNKESALHKAIEENVLTAVDGYDADWTRIYKAVENVPITDPVVTDYFSPGCRPQPYDPENPNKYYKSITKSEKAPKKENITKEDTTSLNKGTVNFKAVVIRMTVFILKCLP